MDYIKQELDIRGYYVHVYKQDGYKAYSLVFEKKNDIYSVREHLSTESGYEEDLDFYYESKDFNEIVKHVKENGYEIH